MALNCCSLHGKGDVWVTLAYALIEREAYFPPILRINVPVEAISCIEVDVIGCVLGYHQAAWKLSVESNCISEIQR